MVVGSEGIEDIGFEDTYLVVAIDKAIDKAVDKVVDKAADKVDSSLVAMDIEDSLHQGKK